MRLYEKIKINLKDGETTQFRILDFKILKKDQNKSKTTLYWLFGNQNLSYSNKNDKTKPIWYLKMNRDDAFSMSCLQNWIDIIDILDVDFYIICDRNKLEKHILRNIIFKNSNIKFIKSYKNTMLEKIVKCVATPKWEKAAYAHLSTFYHSKLNGYKSFWNIDADDTMILLPAKNVSAKILSIQNYGEKHKIDNFSLDMHTSKTFGDLWSFGITYTLNHIDYFKIFNENDDVSWRKHKSLRKYGKDMNLDRYFSVLGKNKVLKNKTFYIENSYFIHYGNFMHRPRHFGIYHWANKKFVIPILLHGFNNQKYGKVPLYNKNCIKFTNNVSKKGNNNEVF